ncbi:hypothetical protein CXG50_02330 [Pseudomonas plecoglossicida]|uniref:TniQ domain-containing protein n=3 Tax=Pseudomonas TaxID=286 RepID=A0A2A3M5W9_PSEDL|nr:hypothetical protein B479_25920 [Pseudomonas putida HB3267]PBJ95478.1 hypothetical protein CMV24_10405 [Pseudomonas plecoglossicida]PLP85853.1 hypothetical protein CX682_29510 [Pseudomonas sp. FFUP_PS_41]RNF75387.1 hypothetical protein EFJ98_03225 [Pseudomonas putida]PLU86940.1 hypothetical protein CXG44_13465 [Pseudomonas plecoglossicida]
METSYTWHPGARCVNPRWPLTPPILPDELFSSWLVRTAHAHGCLPSSLTGAVWPGSHAWSVDPDRAHPWANLDRLSGMSGLSSHQLLASTLWPVMQRLHPRPVLQRSMYLPWILPLGCRSRSHAGGLMCCPDCIKSGVPHFLLQHRLAWHTACPWHNMLLIDRCVVCSSALQPARLCVDRPLSECHQCGQPLGKAALTPPVEAALTFQTFADSASQSMPFYGRVPLGFSEWMCIARVMVSFLEQVTRHPSAGSHLFCEAMGVDLSQLQASSLGLPFEYGTPSERAGLLGQAWVIMQAGPERFVESAAEAKLPVTSFPLPAVSVPDILHQMLSVLTNTPHKPGHMGLKRTHSPQEVWRRWHRLQRRTHRNGI